MNGTCHRSGRDHGHTRVIGTRHGRCDTQRGGVARVAAPPAIAGPAVSLPRRAPSTESGPSLSEVDERLVIAFLELHVHQLAQDAPQQLASVRERCAASFCSSIFRSLTGLARDTVGKLLVAEVPPWYSRARAGSIVDPFKDWICEQLQADPKVPSQRLRELAGEIGYAGGKSIFDAYVREVRPRFLVKRTFQRTIYRAAELIQCDLWEPSQHVPVGYGQTRRGWVVTTQSCWSRAFAGTLVFSKEAPDILAGLARSLSRLGIRPEKLVWDRESAIAGRGKPSEPFLCFAASWRSAGSFLMLGMLRRRGSWSVSIGSCARTRAASVLREPQRAARAVRCWQTGSERSPTGKSR